MIACEIRGAERCAKPGWLPFAPWLLVTTALLQRPRPRLALQIAVALALQLGVRSRW